MKIQMLFVMLSGITSLSITTNRNFEAPRDPLAQMELCTTKKCSTNVNSGRFGCARNCTLCTDQVGCQKWHGGTDLLASQNTKFKAIFSGKTILQSFSKSWGFFVVIESQNVTDRNGLSFETVSIIYCHLNPSQNIPAEVQQGTELGLTGNTGNALDEKPHLHIEAYDGKFNNADRHNALDAESFFSTSLPDNFGPNPNNHVCHPNMVIAEDDCCGELKNS